MTRKAPVNRLINASSPYLLQHAHNPVDWYEWGDEAFERAVREDKPIFLSIGYSTCHWCHVMAHESFEDEEVARMLNENFICIKVDREERPDIDQLYMKAATTLIGRGGWPLTIVMGPDKKPFFAGTYFPKISVGNRIGMLDLLPKIVEAWQNQRNEINLASDQIINALRDQKIVGASEVLGEVILKQADLDFRKNYDSKTGGFGRAPKFPSPHNLIFLLREGYRTGEQELTDVALHTLRQMRLGGIFDQIGYGFHRYSTDSDWHVPHFEKMLYDQAGLMLAYTEAWEVSGDPLFRQTIEEIYLYVADKLKSPEGAYYAAEDADSDGEEGKFYVWSWDELQNHLGENLLTKIASSFKLEEGGNFQDEASRQASGTNIFHLSSETAYQQLLDDPDWEAARQNLYQAREKRVHPGLDSKILADWNGLTLSALSRAAAATGESKYGRAAGELADYLIREFIDEKGQLHHLPKHGKTIIPGFLDDYSFVIQGLRQYYEVSFDPKYLAIAIQLQERQLIDFWDDESGGFFFTAAGNEELLVRSKEIYDGAMPSGNSVAALNLYYLGRLTEQAEWESFAMKIATSFSQQVKQAPRGFSALLQSVQLEVSGSREIVIAGSSSDLVSATTVLRKVYNPFKLLLYRSDGNSEAIERISSFLKYQKAIDHKLTVYICENYACQQPITDISTLEETLREMQWD